MDSNSFRIVIVAMYDDCFACLSIILIDSVEAVKVGEQSVLCVIVMYVFVLWVCEASSKNKMLEIKGPS